MSYLLTSASDWRDLLSVIKSFAVANGWTAVYDQIAAKGQLGLSKLNCHCALGSIRSSASDVADANTFNRTDSVNGGTVVDTYIVMALGTSLSAGTTRYWGHPGSIVTTYNDADRVPVNDLTGPFTNVWLFTPADGNAIHVVVQSAAERFTHFSFGNLDVRGLNQPRCGYAGGMDHIWWPDHADYTSNSSCDFNYVEGAHSWYVNGNDNVLNVHIPTGLLNTAYTWGVTAPVILKTIDNTFSLEDVRSGHYTSSAGNLLDFFMTIQNQETAGGIPLHSLPMMFSNGGTDTGIMAWLGELPDTRLVNMANLNPGQEIKYGADIWTCFPWKQKGLWANSNYGPNGLPICNTQDYGIAFKKVV